LTPAKRANALAVKPLRRHWPTRSAHSARLVMAAIFRLTGVPEDMTLPNIVLPSQYFETRHEQTPEKRLMIAVFCDAIECLEKYRPRTDRRGGRLFHEAKQWFLADEPEWPYSFEYICGTLDLDSNAVRQRLRVVPARRGSGGV
jgi:hypothetical protein